MHFVLQVTKILCEVREKGSLVPPGTRLGERQPCPRQEVWEKVYTFVTKNWTVRRPGTEVYVLSLFTDQATSEARDQSDGKQGGSEGLPARVTALCELLVFVKNLELTSNSHLAGKTDRPGSK